jgi:DNA-binding response OmpR family regulator
MDAAYAQPGPHARRVLLVEDDKPTREALVRLLEEDGHDVRAAANGVRGLVALRDFRPERVLLDLMLPDFAGERVLEAVRLSHPATRVAVVSGVEDADRMNRLGAAGADAVFRKPVLPSDVLDWVRSPASGERP